MLRRERMQLSRLSAINPSYITMTVNLKLHRVSKNIPPLSCYNLDIHGSITIIFGTSVPEKLGNQNVLYFPTSRNLRFCTMLYLGKQETRQLRLFT